jgi:hypothetical protein
LAQRQLRAHQRASINQCFVRENARSRLYFEPYTFVNFAQ